jgi:hypothetical protein
MATSFAVLGTALPINMLTIVGLSASKFHTLISWLNAKAPLNI